MSKPVIVIEGRMGQNPESFLDGKGVKFGLAVNVGKDLTDWYNVVVWNDYVKTFVLKYFKKGSGAVVSGLLSLKDVPDSKGKYVNVEALSVQFALAGAKKKDDTEISDDPDPSAAKEDVPF